MRLHSFYPTNFLDFILFSLGPWMLTATFMANAGLGSVIVSCGFESSGDTWQYTAEGKNLVSTDVGESDFPANQRIMARTSSWSVADGVSSTLIFSEVLLAGWTNVSVTYHVSATASVSSKGKNPSDRVQAYVANTTETFGDEANIVLQGSNNARWGFDGTSSYRSQTAGGGVLSVQPTSGGLQTDACYSNYQIKLAGGESSVAFKLYAIGSTPNTFWNFDEIALNGTASSSHTCEWNGMNGKWNNSTGAGWIDRTNANALSAWNAVRGDNAYFTGANSTVTIAEGTTVAARSLTFTADGCSIQYGNSSSKLALTNGGSGGAGANTIEVTSGNTATINVSIIGNPGVGLTKTGAGTLVLKGNNFYTGETIVHEGKLIFDAKSILRSATIDVRGGAALDISASGPYTLADGVTLKGSGTILGNLIVAGTHAPGNSMGIETIQGDYTMDGLLQMAVGGTTPGNNDTGHDQVLVTGDRSHDISLSGELALTWTGSGWSRPGNKIWILRNDTNGSLEGAFSNYANGDAVGSYDGRSWNIYYGADIMTGNFTGGNDVLLATMSPVPEPTAFGLVAMPAFFWVTRRFLRRAVPNGK